MRTGIYVHKPTAVVIQASENGLKVARLGGAADFATLGVTTKLQLEPGVYRILSNQPVTVTGNDITQVSVAGKDPWPDPDPGVVALSTKDAIKEFFASKSFVLPGDDE